MNDFIEELLKKCKVAVVPDFNKNENKILIKSKNKISNNNQDSLIMNPGCYYIIKLQKYLIYPPDNFTLNVNWNNGINPKSEYMLVTPIKFIGKMTQFDGCGYDISSDKSLDDIYSGLWLPQKSIEIIRSL